MIIGDVIETVRIKDRWERGTIDDRLPINPHCWRLTAMLAQDGMV